MVMMMMMRRTLQGSFIASQPSTHPVNQLAPMQCHVVVTIRSICVCGGKKPAHLSVHLRTLQALSPPAVGSSQQRLSSPLLPLSTAHHHALVIAIPIVPIISVRTVPCFIVLGRRAVTMAALRLVPLHDGGRDGLARGHE